MYYLKISECDICSGPGIRVVTFVTGTGKLYTKDTQNNLLEILAKDHIAGITITGDPLHNDNVKEVYDLISRIRKDFPHKTIWLCSDCRFDSIINNSSDTCSEENSVIKYRQKAILNSDVYIDRELIKSHKGIFSVLDCSDNQIFIEIKDYLKTHNMVE